MKTEPIGICDLCKQEVAAPYTSKGKPRRYCSVDCKNTANSRAGSEIRAAKARQRVKEGRWQNPAKLNPPSPAEQGERSRKGRLKEVTEGRWRNPALSDEARAKLSRPRKHSGPLHSAHEQLKQGKRLPELTPEERAAYSEYRRGLYAQRKAAMSAEEIEQQRARWRERYHRSKRRGQA